jgi:hypothetical protein
MEHRNLLAKYETPPMSFHFHLWNEQGADDEPLFLKAATTLLLYPARRK